MYFLGKTAWLKGAINDSCKGNVYYDCIVSGVYNKNNSIFSGLPQGYIEFGSNSTIDGLSLNLSSNTLFRTLGVGNMGESTIGAGAALFAHKGTMIRPLVNNSDITSFPIVAFNSI